MSSLSLDVARSILGNDVLGPAEIATAFGFTPEQRDSVPFTQSELEAARAAGEMLVLRVPGPAGAPLTIQQKIQRSPQAFDARFLRKMGYQLKDEWGIELEPLALSETCAAGWYLARKTPLEDSLNRSYEEQDAALQIYAKQFGAAAENVRRRLGVEIVYDSLLYFASRQQRLLDKSWDWSATRTVDGGYLNVGGFGEQGLQVFSYSRAVRHGALGICPTRPAAR
jgi:hypothetical protein